MYRIRNFFRFIKRFCYYGYIGASKTYDFDAAGVHTLIHAHMVRVKRFMNSDKTHLVWNDKPDNKGMRKLAEFTELSRRIANDEYSVGYNWGKIYDERIQHRTWGDIETEEESKAVSRAFKKDQLITDHQTKRYYYMLEKYVPGFWD